MRKRSSDRRTPHGDPARPGRRESGKAQRDRAHSAADTPEASRVFLYIEGPGDRGILRAWTYRLLPAKLPALLRDSVILGGRRPERAIDHFERQRGPSNEIRGLCVLDRDDEHGWVPPVIPGLDFFTWSRRHIESYLLVPEAVLRAVGAGREAQRLDRAMRELLPEPGDEAAHRVLDAKRLLGRNGPLAQALGRPLPLARIARATRESELHGDVIALFDRVRALLVPGAASASEERA